VKTLEKYIEAGGGHAGFGAAMWRRASRDRRFNYLLVASVIVHLAFYTTIVILNYWAMKQIRPARRSQTVLVEVTRLAPELSADDVRAAPEPLERADLSRLEYDPDNPDDTHLISRSPSPSVERGSGGRLPSVAEIERQMRASGSQAGPGQNAPVPGQSSRASSVPAPLDNIPQPDLSASAPAAPALPPSPAAAAPQSAPLPPSGTRPAVPSGSRRGESTETRALGLEEIRARYEAYVREKIRRVNETNMPREWIKDMLHERAAVTFAVTLGRDGRIQSARLTDASGYRLLDDRAREAIYIASPFEGYPQNAGETITFRVTVYYFPLW
jgi:TonB family protein